MEQFIKDQITYGLKYLPSNLMKSFFIPESNDETKRMRERGFIKGVCHSKGDIEQIKNAGIEWVRTDIPFPFNADGTLSESYEQYKKTSRNYQEHGIRVMAVTPYPKDYIAYGADIRKPEDEKKIIEIAEFLIEDIKDSVSALQVTNEMGIPHFTIPLTMDEAAKFIGIQLKAMYPLRGDLIIGYNSAVIQADLHTRMAPYFKYCDYVGIDIYIGCFSYLGGFMNMFTACLRYLWALTGKPIILQEFGYISGGKPKSHSEKQSILKGYGVSSEEEAKQNMAAFVERLPEKLGNHIKKLGNNDPSRYYSLLFRTDLINHLYRDMPVITKIPGCPHTPEGQAEFYLRILPMLYKLDFLCGTIIYCYSDSEECYICGQSDCPIETRWGLTDCSCNPKPSYFAVKQEFAKMK